MNRIIRVVLLSLIGILQVLTLAGGFITYGQMLETITRLTMENTILYEEIHPSIRINPALPNPFPPLPLVLLGLLGLFPTAVLLIDQLDQLSDKNGR